MLLTENEGVVIETPEPEIFFDKKSVVFKMGNEIIVDPYTGTAEVGEIIPISVLDDDPLLSPNFLVATEQLMKYLPSPRSL